jgi:hypothetical protein
LQRVSTIRAEVNSNLTPIKAS